MVDKICEVCGTAYTVHDYRAGTSKYCSKVCLSEGNKTSTKMACECCGCTFKVFKSKEGARRFCSMKCRNEYCIGENSAAWKGGSSLIDNRTDLEYKEWRFNVFKKDNFTCQKCGERGGDLNVHHILAYSRYPEYRTVVENGDTLCIACHKEFHSLYGVRRFTDHDYWEWI